MKQVCDVLQGTMDNPVRDGPCLPETPDTPAGLNRGYLLDPADAPYPDLSIIVPETPR